MRLIDADAMRDDWLENGENEYVYDTNAVLASIDEQPTIDAVPVVHAKWVKDTYNGRTHCSACKEGLPGVWYYNGEDEDENYEEIDSTPYCPNCGARMDGGADRGV